MEKKLTLRKFEEASEIVKKVTINTNHRLDILTIYLNIAVSSRNIISILIFKDYKS